MRPRLPRRYTALLVGACLLAALLVLLESAPGWASTLFEFRAPHHAVRSRAVLSAPLVDAVAVAREKAHPSGVQELIEFGLRQTGQRLRFGLEHKSSLEFDQREREGNCIEYSQLFARIFEQAAGAAGVKASALVVHSDNARLFGVRVPRRGWESHDWVLIVERDAAGRETARHFVDAAFDDAGLAWDIEASVFGRVDVPSAR